MKSSRLSRKALADIYGKPLLQRLIENIEKSTLREQIVLCTSTNHQDDEIESFSMENGVKCFRGSELDVMDRFLSAAKKYNAKTIARVTGDNPFTDPDMLSNMYSKHIASNAEYTYTDDLPVGARAEIIDVYALSRIHEQLIDKMSSEYMTFMLNRPDKVNVLKVNVDSLILKRPELSLTVDTPEDLELVRSIYSNFNGEIPSLESVILWLDSVPDKIITCDYRGATLPDGVDCSYYND